MLSPPLGENLGLLATLAEASWSWTNFFAWAPLGAAIIAAEWIIRIALTLRIVRKRCPGPESLSWLAVIAFVPIIGLLAYALFGQRRLGTRRIKRHDQVAALVSQCAVTRARDFLEPWRAIDGPAQRFAVAAERLTGLAPVPGNRLELLQDATEFLDRLIADVDKAASSVHIHTYIFGQTPRTDVLCDALIRAAQRGVTCRLMVDAVGSRPWLKGHWPADLRAAGVQVEAGLPVNPFRRRLHRIDLRNHRKIAVIDGHIAYCGSQNIVDEKVLVRRLPKRYRHWLDATCRIHGPAALALQAAFLADWLTSSDEQIADLRKYLVEPAIGDVLPGSSIVHVVPSGPNSHVAAIHQCLVTMLAVAKRSVVMTTPYFVPDEALKAAIISASLRGVDVTLILPAKLDNKVVAAAARAHYAELLDAGIRILHHAHAAIAHSKGRKHEPAPGLLHAKAAVIDDELSMIGSANLDMRSFWINFECTLFVYDRDLARQVRAMQDGYARESTPITAAQWSKRSGWEELRDNAAQLLGPLL